MASGSGASDPTTFSEPFNATPFTGNDDNYLDNYFDDDFNFDDLSDDPFASSPLIDLTGYV